jgi:LAS superfamily LD-carboxypeptidase LdcB
MGKPMRPDVAQAFDRMARAARADGVARGFTSADPSDAEQARLFARHPDPKWVAPPGKSLHRLGTELDLGPPSAYGWLARNARRFGFVQRYFWEKWH